jgi:hypothetical protein
MISADQPAADATAAGAGPEVTATEAAATGPAVTGSAANGSTTKASAQPAAPVVQEESLDAFKFVVIPVLKRVLPVAAAGAVLAVVIRRLTRKKSS